MKILVVEDEKVTRENYVETLRNRGHSVEAVVDGGEALAHINGHKYDALVVDVMTPRMSGLEFLVEAHKRGETAPAVVVTGYAKEHCYGIDGIAAVLEKPVTGERLVDCVEHLLEVRHEQGH